MHKIEGAHLQYAKNHYAKVKYKGMKTAAVTDYTNQTPLSISDRKMAKFNSPQKKRKYLIKCAQNKRYTSSMCEQS